MVYSFDIGTKNLIFILMLLSLVLELCEIVYICQTWIKCMLTPLLGISMLGLMRNPLCYDIGI